LHVNPADTDGSFFQLDSNFFSMGHFLLADVFPTQINIIKAFCEMDPYSDRKIDKVNQP